MYTILIFIALVWIAGIILSVRNKDGSVLMFFFIFSLFGVFCLLVVLSSGIFPTKSVLAETHNLRAAANNSSVEGRFFLGSGYIAEFEKVGYFYEIAPSQYKHGELPLDEIVIIATDLEENETPRIEMYKDVFTEDWMRYWAIEEGKVTKIIFHVQESSVSNYLIFTP